MTGLPSGVQAVAIVETEVCGVSAWHAVCVDCPWGWKSRRVDSEQEAVTAAEGHSHERRWVREAPIDGRVGTWFYYAADGTRWEVERRSGEDDFGWYLFGPGGEPFGEFISRRLGPAKAIAEDYAEDYPGARDWLRAGQGGEVYAERARAHGW